MRAATSWIGAHGSTHAAADTPRAATFTFALRVLEPPAKHGYIAMQVPTLRTRALAHAAITSRDALRRASSPPTAARASAFADVLLLIMAPPQASSAFRLTPSAPISCGHVSRRER